jgi:hypothetical protein
LRVGLSRVDIVDARLGDGQIVTGTRFITILADDVAAPAVDDIVTTGTRDEAGTFTPAEVYRIVDEPLPVKHGMAWRCGAEPVALP